MRIIYKFFQTTFQSKYSQLTDGFAGKIFALPFRKFAFQM